MTQRNWRNGWLKMVWSLIDELLELREMFHDGGYEVSAAGEGQKENKNDIISCY